MPNISFIEFVIFITAIVVGVGAFAFIWSAIESVFPKLKGCFARIH